MSVGTEVKALDLSAVVNNHFSKHIKHGEIGLMIHSSQYLMNGDNKISPDDLHLLPVIETMIYDNIEKVYSAVVSDIIRLRDGLTCKIVYHYSDYNTLSLNLMGSTTLYSIYYMIINPNRNNIGSTPNTNSAKLFDRLIKHLTTLCREI